MEELPRRSALPGKSYRVVNREMLQAEWAAGPENAVEARIRVPAASAPEPPASTLKKLAFRCALALVFIRFSYMHETITFLTGVNTYVLYLFTPLALVGALATGGVQRTFREWPARFWLGFLVWMGIAVPFSSWPGGSFGVFETYLRTDIPMLLVISGVCASWRDCRKMLGAIAVAAVFNLGVANLFTRYTSGERLSLQWSGAIGNSNDLAAHLLLVLPAVLFFAIRPKARMLTRAVALAVVGLGLFSVLHTGSRGALLAIGLTMVYVLVTGTGRQRMAAALAPVGLVVLVFLLPGSTWQRLTAFGDSAQSPGEAIESSEAREYLLKTSLIYTLQKPFFGVGPGQFSSFEGSSMANEGLRGNWHETHNSLTEVSSECGLPALIFYAAAVAATFRLLARARKLARASANQEALTAIFCVTLALVAYTVASLFLNFAYKFYMPAMSSLVIALWATLSRASVAATPAAVPVPWRAKTGLGI